MNDGTQPYMAPLPGDIEGMTKAQLQEELRTAAKRIGLLSRENIELRRKVDLDASAKAQVTELTNEVLRLRPELAEAKRQTGLHKEQCDWYSKRIDELDEELRDIRRALLVTLKTLEDERD